MRWAAWLLVAVADVVDGFVDGAVNVSQLDVAARHDALGDGEEGLKGDVLKAGSRTALLERGDEAVYREQLPFMGHIKSITTDNGTEFAKHKWLAEALQTTVYFAHPYCSWEKGLIEYTNRLFKQYIPKGVRFSNFTDEQVKQIQYKINARPRKKLGFLTPVQLFYRTLSA